MSVKFHSLPAGAAILVTIGLSTAAAIPVAFAGVSSPPQLSVQQAERIALTAFSIPTSYTLQNESFNSSNSTLQPPTYSLSYQNSDPSAGNQWIDVTIDANTGVIVNYNRPSPDNQFVFPVPVSEAKAKQIADSWVQKLFPAQYKQVQPLPLTPTSGSLVGPTQYTFNYERMVNGIPAPFNGFTITIDQEGNLVSLADNWTSLNFPSTAKIISQSRANSVYQSALQLHLEYQSVYHTNAKPTTDLIYQPTQQSYPNWWGGQFDGSSMIEFPVINAATGKIVDSTGSAYTPEKYTLPTPLVPGGPKRPDNAPPVNWTEEQALTYAEKLFGISPSDTILNVNQYQNPNSDTTWNFHWQTAQKVDIQVSVDATKGSVVSFSSYSNQPQAKTPEKQPQPTQSQVDKTVNEFATKVFANNTGAIAIVQNPTSPKVPSGGLKTSYQVVYLVNGIPDQTKGGNINIDPQTGAVQSLWMNTQQTASHTLPTPNQALPVTQAVTKWMQAVPLRLEYLETQPQMMAKQPMVATNSTAAGKSATSEANLPPQPEVILTYAPVADQDAYGQFNAVTGVFESPNSQTPYSGTIHDLTGNPAAEQIQLLVNRELVSVDSHGDVHPNQTMTHSAFIKLLVDALGFQGRYNPQMLASSAAKSALASVPQSSPDYQEIGAAYSMGWIPADQPFQPNVLTTRDYAAQVFARALGFTPLLAHPEVFRFQATDASTIPASHQVADSLAITLGLFNLQNGAFDPSNDVTLASTAVAVVQAAVIEGEQGQPYPPGPRPMG